MTKKQKIINHYKSNFEKYLEYNHFYFNEDNPKISDNEYDKLKKDLLDLEKIHS